VEGDNSGAQRNMSPQDLNNHNAMKTYGGSGFYSSAHSKPLHQTKAKRLCIWSGENSRWQKRITSYLRHSMSQTC